MKHQTEFKDGEKYVLDADFNNGSIIILVSHGDIFGKVKGDNSVWETMLNRLTEIPEWAKQYIEQSPLVDHQKQREVYIPCDEEAGFEVITHTKGQITGKFVCHVKKATTPIVQGYSEDTLRAAISAGLSIGYSPNYKLENREQEIQNILSSLPQSTSITK